MRRKISLLVAALVIVAVATGGLSTACAAERPNILFIMSDDHAFQAVSCYDGRLMRTPNIDSTASEGVRFDRWSVTTSL